MLRRTDRQTDVLPPRRLEAHLRVWWLLGASGGTLEITGEGFLGLRGVRGTLSVRSPSGPRSPWRSGLPVHQLGRESPVLPFALCEPRVRPSPFNLVFLSFPDKRLRKSLRFSLGGVWVGERYLLITLWEENVKTRQCRSINKNLSVYRCCPYDSQRLSDGGFGARKRTERGHCLPPARRPGREPGRSLLVGMRPRWHWAGSDAAACHAEVLKVSSFLLFLYFLIYEREVALFSMFLLRQVAGVKRLQPCKFSSSRGDLGKVPQGGFPKSKVQSEDSGAAG